MLYKLISFFQIDYSWLNVFRYTTFRTIIASLTSLVLFFVFGKWAINKLRSSQLKQYIREDGPSSHFSKKGTPTMGGCIILTIVMISVLLWAKIDNVYIWVCFFSVLSFGLIGFADDYLKTIRKSSKGLSFWEKIVLQFISALIISVALYLYPGFDHHLTVPFFKNIKPDPGLWYIPFAVLFIMGFSNAVNLTDGLDGLAIGPVTIAFLSYLVFSFVSSNINIASYLQIPYVAGSGELTVMCGAVVGAGLGFLWYNTYPAEVFMGDVGSLPLGALLGTVAIIAKQELVLILVGGLFVVEALSVIFQVAYFKMTGGQRIFRMAPIHHHFELKGWPESRVTVRFWIIAIILALLSLSTIKLR
jgi:phospho-N-acetylmuramoyl-pentapeptide-transferase